ncbi:hypothetical protein [Sphingopyxis macrogoltabida]|uniref:Uncharacterized protein n=1 Tax=Sphingopyxis macrogoltabida TaxID=33050 RepID=A0AAC8Z2D8_SPHMC|nr:hypothetical protein [Sphingopyxis macrogoltabida]ALJ14117.1 hypothetical protein LH19_14685 [Sphingopyxis macrogoltabida]AMU90384.1 hypothetical protein ATM17_15265 [Sphingopyxis macrogoltabida]
MRRLSVEITTAADGSATAYSPRVSGAVHSIVYEKIDFADGVDFTVTAEKTGEGIWAESNVNAAASRYPRAATHTTAGAAALYASGGTAVLDKPAIANDRFKIVIAQGGNAKSGVLHFLVD